MDPDSVPLKKKNSPFSCCSAFNCSSSSFGFQKIKNGEKLVVDKAMKGLKAIRVIIPTNKHELKPAANRSALTQPFPVA